MSAIESKCLAVDPEKSSLKKIKPRAFKFERILDKESIFVCPQFDQEHNHIEMYGSTRNVQREMLSSLQLRWWLARSGHSF